MINVVGNEEVEDLLSMLETLARITEKRDIKLSLQVTFLPQWKMMFGMEWERKRIGLNVSISIDGVFEFNL